MPHTYISTDAIRRAAALVLILTLSACGGGGGGSDSGSAQSSSTSDPAEDDVQRNAQPDVLQGNKAPEISGSPVAQVVAGAEYNFTPAASDLDGDSLAFRLAGAPPWVSFDSGTGRIGGTPADEDVGLYPNLRITVTDGMAEAALPPFSIMVVASAIPNQVPVLSGKPASAATVGEQFSFRPSAYDPDGDPLGFTAQNLPSWATFNPATGRIAGKPTAADSGMYRNIMVRATDGMAQVAIGPFELEVVDVAAGARKYNPGHYISMNPKDTQKDMVEALRPGVAGIQRRYHWRELETGLDVYDFSEVKSDLDLLASQGRMLVVFIEDKTFNGTVPTPQYLRNNFTRPNRAGGYTALRWKPYVAQRFKKLLTELGRRFDSHPAFEGVAVQESEPGFDDSVLAANGYTPDIYRDALIDVLTGAAKSMPNSTVFWYMNFFPQRMAYLPVVANAVAKAGVAVGGPDVLPDDYPLDRLVYPIYDELKGKMTLFNSMQYNSYKHVHKDTSYPTYYWTSDELF